MSSQTILDRDPDDSDFAQNLRYLCSFYKSTSEVCRKIGINRQQFNKYVAGNSRPSSRTLRIICDFFGVEEYEILSPTNTIKNIVKIKGLKNLVDNETLLIKRVAKLIEIDQESISEYLGYYHTYYQSFSKPGKILKSLTYVYMNNAVASYKRTERLINKSRHEEENFVYKYEGIFILLRDRISMIDRETLTGNEISQTVLYPSFKNKVGRLPGLILGTSGKTSREPICARILMQYIGSNTDVRAAMRTCGLYDLDSPDIDDNIKKSIVNDIPPDQFALRANPQ